ncbi:hypothetical protein SNOG_10499 [Parastagonospora nodorum SN15]|uniref:Autophagy-related protein 14 n=1 Tax=Phaeosphaeria nodorum (strain SN15 / ATCC MYA-4574 / FGSC 10173) TaxID=321614 RepID=Q0UCL5_PHANO|nr:hypothetical protein SNOG_10499 [Parastagonospora nodorum SN15]EAT81893.1 hypothetical protein SNOG_10499 [Parastagonospora nodorum SN15]
MATSSQAPAQSEPPPLRERPWLLPYNRKLRHLQGITIRNLTLTSSPLRSRGKTIDDDALPSTLKSPTKALALRESKGLAHSRSSSDLKLPNGALHEPTTPTKSPRPAFGRGLRRRSTLEWTNASPLTRQKKLEDIAADRMADTFFTLHVEQHDEPVYISEIAEKAMNPNFRFFDLASCGPGVTRLDRLTVRIWAKTESMDKWQYLMDYTTSHRKSEYAMKSLRHPNKAREAQVLTSSSYDALMRLSTLDDCIQDALVTRDRIADEIGTILEANKESMSAIAQVPETEETLRTMEAAVNAEKRRVNATRRRRDELQANLQQRREKMQAGRDLQNQVEADLPEQQAKCKEMRELIEKTQEEITGQRRRVCEDLLRLYPIEPAPGKSFAFTIRGLLLPNSAFDDVREDVTAAALSYVAQVVSQLSPYLSVILPYPITLHGSTSTIDDPLAVSQSNQNNLRTYPLYMKGVVRYRFEYGVFLLNKNIEILSNALGLRPIDIRQTLPNLKYLLYVATAGKGELPARKAGGIKGLLRQDGMSSRKGSMDSIGTTSSAGTPIAEFKRNLDGAGMRKGVQPKSNGAPVAAVGSLKHNASIHTGSRLRPVD